MTILRQILAGPLSFCPFAFYGFSDSLIWNLFGTWAMKEGDLTAIPQHWPRKQAITSGGASRLVVDRAGPCRECT
jgi:hypothetical protein